MRSLTCVIAAGMLAVATAPALATTTGYGVAFDTLYRVDLEQRQAEEVGSGWRFAGQVIGNLSGLTQTDDGTLYVAAGGMKLLVALDTQGDAVNVVGSFGLEGQGDPARNDAMDLGMTASCDGRLWLSSGYAQKLWSVNKGTGAATLVGSTGAAITGLAARGNELFGAAGKDDNRLYRIDLATGKATAVGGFGAEVPRWINSVSLSFDDDGTLWAVLNYVPPESDGDALVDWSDLARIDPDTGTLELIGPIEGPESLRQIGMKGFTVGPAPCTLGGPAPVAAPIDAPWALALLALLLAAVAVGSRSLRTRLPR